MANALYNAGKDAFLKGEFALGTATIKATLIDTADYTVDLALHDTWDDVATAAKVATAALTNKSITAGVFDADDLTFTSVSGDTCEAVIIWRDTGTPSTSRLIAYLDTFAAGMPVTPNGGNIGLTWDNGTNKIFRLGSSGMYSNAATLFLGGQINLTTDTIRVALIDEASYTPSLTTDDYLDDVPSGARVATATLANCTVSGGVFDADDVTFTSVTGAQSEGLLLYKWTGVESTSPLILYIGSFTSGMPVTPNGGDIVVQWSNGSNKIFAV